MNAIRFIAIAGCLAVSCGASVVAAEDDTRFELSAGMEYTTGDYGTDVDIEDLYVPITATLDFRKVAVHLTVPYLSVRAPEGTIIIGPGGEPIPGPGEMTTNSGLGDIVGSVTVFDVVRSRRLGLALDLTGSVKLPTADETKSLGTGETDYSLRADLLKFVDQLTLIGSAGYKVRGDPAGIDYDNVLTWSAGGSYKFSDQLKAGLFFDYRESSIAGNDPIRELSAFMSRRINGDWRLQVFALTGFTDSGPQWGAGFRVKRTM